MKIRTVLSITVCALACACRAQTALRGDLRPSDKVVTNEIDATALSALSLTNAILRAAITNEAALRAAGDAAGEAALSGTNALLRAAITNEAALRAGADAALADLVATGRFTRLLESGGADEWISLAAGTATLWRVTETGRTITTNTVTNAVEVVDTVTTTNVTDTVEPSNIVYRATAVAEGCMWDTNIVFTLQSYSAVTNFGEQKVQITYDYGVINHHQLYYTRYGIITAQGPDYLIINWITGDHTWHANYPEETYDWENEDPLSANYFSGYYEWPDTGTLYMGGPELGMYITVQAVTNAITYTTNIVTTASTNIITNIVTTVHTNVTAETNAVATYATHADLAAGASAVTNEAALRAAGDAAGLDALSGTNALLYAALTNEAALRTAGDNAITETLNASTQTIASIQSATLTNELDLAALRTYHYGSPDIIESPTNWFEFDGGGTITGFSYTNGRENVVIPWQINNNPVTALGASAFYKDYQPSQVQSLAFPRSIKTIGGWCFRSASLTNVVFSGDAPSAEGVFNETSFSSVTVINPKAAGWGKEFSNRMIADDYTPLYVVRPALHADEIYQAGELAATTGHVAQAVASKLDRSGGTATNLTLISEWQELSGVTGSVTLTNRAERPIQCTGTGAVSLAFSGLQPPRPVYLTLGGFESVAWPANTYAVGGWGAWQTNRLNHFAVWQVGTNIYVNQITTSEE